MDEPVWMTYAGFVFDALASVGAVVAIALSVQAYKVAVKSYQVARDQHRKTFDLETLRKLASVLDKKPSPFVDHEAISLMWLLPDDTLPIWEVMWIKEMEQARPAGSPCRPLKPGEWQEMADDLRRAIKARIE
ncbi:hypothetical protein [Micromonospora sp. DT62]|uniref:hypothetical protein n=1 Tax=Micromonospora sp. DT62 TaxID=3416521 RepID=UPI003CEFE892